MNISINICLSYTGSLLLSNTVIKEVNWFELNYYYIIIMLNKWIEFNWIIIIIIIIPACGAHTFSNIYSAISEDGDGVCEGTTFPSWDDRLS
jgi:hypothetical protein